MFKRYMEVNFKDHVEPVVRLKVVGELNANLWGNERENLEFKYFKRHALEGLPSLFEKWCQFLEENGFHEPQKNYPFLVSYTPLEEYRISLRSLITDCYCGDCQAYHQNGRKKCLYKEMDTLAGVLVHSTGSREVCLFPIAKKICYYCHLPYEDEKVCVFQKHGGEVVHLAEAVERVKPTNPELSRKLLQSLLLIKPQEMSSTKAWTCCGEIMKPARCNNFRYINPCGVCCHTPASSNAREGGNFAKLSLIRTGTETFGVPLDHGGISIFHLQPSRKKGGQQKVSDMEFEKKETYQKISDALKKKKGKK